MNKIYRTVYNTATGTWVVASELAKGRTKTSKTAMALAVAAALALPGGIARAGTNKEEDAVEQEIAMVNMAPSSIGTDAIATGGSMGLMGGASIMATGDYAAGGGVIGATGGNNTSIGAGSNIPFYSTAQDVSNAIAIGGATVSNANIGTTAVGSIGIGSGASVGGGGSIVIGYGASNGNSSAIAIGTSSRSAGGGGTVALGTQATTTAGGAVAIGLNSRTTGARSASVGQNTGTSRADAFSVGNDVATNADGTARTAFTRQVVNVSNGTQANDAANVSQLTPAVTALGGGASINTTTGAVTGPTYNLANGGTQTTVGGALTALDSVLSTKVDDTLVKVGGTTASTISGNANNIAIGAGAQSTSIAGGSPSIAFGSDARATGNNGSMAFGSASRATGASSTALGIRATVDADAAGSQAFGVDASVRGYRDNPTTPTVTHTATNSVAIGSGASVAATATADANNSVAMGNRASVTASNAVALGAGSAATEVNTVSVGNATVGGQRRIVNMAAGTAGTDAVNVSQLTPVVTALGGGATINADGSVTGPTYTLANGGTQTTVGGALGALDGALTTANDNIAKNTTAIGSIRDDMNSGTIGLVQQAGAGANLTVGKNTDGAAVDFTNNAGASRTLTGVANGAVSATSADAINGSQLHGVSTSVASAIGAGSTVNADGSISSPSFTVGDGSGGTTTVHNVGSVVTNLDNRVVNNETAIGDIRSDLSSGTIGLVQQAAAGADLTVGKDTDGAAVNFAGTAGNRTLTGVANGTVSATSTDAINGSQLHGVSSSVASAIGAGSTVNADGSITAPSFTVGDGSGGTTTVHNVGSVVTNLDNRVVNNETAIGDIRSDLSSGTIGLVQQAAAGADLTVGKDTDGAAVNFAGTAGNRTLTGVANGAVSATSTDAINGSQLHGVSTSVASAIGAGSTVNADGSITAPSFTVGDGSGGTKTVHNVGDVVTNLDGRMTTAEGNITNLKDQIGSGTVGLVQQDATSGAITVAAASGGTSVNFAGTAGERTLTGVAKGELSATSTDAVNGAQLHDTNEAVAKNATDITNLDGRVTTAEGDIKTINTNVTNLGDRMTTAEGNITNIRNEMNSGTIGLVQQDATSGVITVAANSGGSTVNFAGMGGATRTLTGLSNGRVEAGSSDAITGDQLHGVKTDLEGKMNDLSGKVDAGLGDLEDRADKLADRTSDLETRTGNLEGSVGDLEGKVGAIKDNLGDLSGLDDRVKELESGSVGTGENSTVVGKGADASGKNSSAIGNGAVASGENSSAVGQGAVASGSNSSAIGQGAVASGNNSSAVGQGSSATGNNAVALGAGSVADRDNAVSVGAAGAERQITNVAAGTAPTDAVNVQQMNNTVRSARQDAMGGVAAAMAIAGLPQSSMPGKTFMALSGSTYGGEQGMAVGASYMTKDGKWVVKGAVNTSTRGEVGAVVGGGFYW
ncbi:ESPR-type extended signal peptide-containing protein [Ralstonia sp. 24A2]|uniref:ESPR-type extended signal peptide-containing protein n=1 Tax=Ralstonia sp. 24A2 TaxID=3447364 RepID=UPI003F69A743